MKPSLLAVSDKATRSRNNPGPTARLRWFARGANLTEQAWPRLDIPDGEPETHHEQDGARAHQRPPQRPVAAIDIVGEAADNETGSHDSKKYILKKGSQDQEGNSGADRGSPQPLQPPERRGLS